MKKSKKLNLMPKSSEITKEMKKNNKEYTKAIKRNNKGMKGSIAKWGSI